MPVTPDALSKLNDQIRMLQQLRDFAANPIAFEAMRQLALNGTGSGEENGHAHPTQRRSRANSLRASILVACKGFNGTHFIVKDVVEAMTREGYQFNAKDVRSAVSSNLQVMAEDGRILLVKRGIGSEPSIYGNVEEDATFPTGEEMKNI